jgi:hypothetical protein
MLPFGQKVNHVNRYGRPHGGSPEQPSELYTFRQLVNELGLDAARQLAPEMHHTDLRGRSVIDAAAVAEFLQMRERERLE